VGRVGNSPLLPPLSRLPAYPPPSPHRPHPHWVQLMQAEGSTTGPAHSGQKPIRAGLTRPLRAEGRATLIGTSGFAVHEGVGGLKRRHMSPGGSGFVRQCIPNIPEGEWRQAGSLDLVRPYHNCLPAPLIEILSRHSRKPAYMRTAYIGCTGIFLRTTRYVSLLRDHLSWTTMM